MKHLLKLKFFIFLTAFLSLNLSQASVFSSVPDSNFRISINNEVSTIVVDPRTNIVYIGGSFDRVNFIETGAGVVFNVTDNQLITPFPKVNGTINVVIPDGSGGWYIGGEFSSVNDVPRLNLAHILANGSLDQDFRPDPNGSVFSLAISGSVLYVGGNFTLIGGQTRDKLAALNLANKGAVLSFSVNHPDNDIIEIREIVVDSSTLYVGGSFTNIAGAPRSNIAAFDLNGNLLPWQTPEITYNRSFQDIYFSPSIRALAVSSQYIYVGGIFNQVGTTTRNYFAAFDKKTGSLTTLNPSPNNKINDLKIVSNILYVAGDFEQFFNQSVRYLSAIDLTTNYITEFGANLDGSVNNIDISSSSIYLAGNFQNVNGVNRRYVAALDLMSNQLLPFKPLPPTSEARSISFYNNKIYIGGSFDGVAGQERRCLIAVNGNNGQLLDWDPDLKLSTTTNFSCSVDTLALTNNVLYVGGRFNYSGQHLRSNLAAFDVSNGFPGNLLNWAPNPDDQVKTIALSNSNIYVGGSFKNIGGQARDGLAAFSLVNNIPGALTNWSPSLSGGGVINSLAVFEPGGTSTPIIFVGGDFEAISNQAKFNLAAVKADGGVITDWNFNSNNTVKALYIAGSSLYVGGLFDNISGEIRKSIAVFDLTQNPPRLKVWNPNIVFNVSTPIINNFLKISSYLYIGGLFSLINDQPRSNLASLDAASGNLLNWAPNANGQVNTLSSFGSSVYVGGSFSTINNLSFPKIAKFNLTLPPIISNIKLNNTFNNNSLLAANTSQVTLTFSTDKPAICRYETVPNISFDGMRNTINFSSDKLFHSVTFSGLQNNTTYTYYLRCQDAINLDSKNTDDYIVNFSIASTASSGGGGGGSAGGGGGGGGYRSAATTSTTTISQDNEALRLYLLQLILQLLSGQKQKEERKPKPPEKTISKIKGIPAGFKFTRQLKFGMKGKDVRYLQVFLKSQGKSIYPEGKITGIFGTATRKAVIRFQEKYKKDILIPQKLKKGTGIVDNLTLKKINQMLK